MYENILFPGILHYHLFERDVSEARFIGRNGPYFHLHYRTTLIEILKAIKSI